MRLLRAKKNPKAPTRPMPTTTKMMLPWRTPTRNLRKLVKEVQVFPKSRIAKTLWLRTENRKQITTSRMRRKSMTR